MTKHDEDTTIAAVFLKAYDAAHAYPTDDRLAFACVLTIMAGAPLNATTVKMIDNACSVPGIVAPALRRLADMLDPVMKPNVEFPKRVSAMLEQFATHNTQG